MPDMDGFKLLEIVGLEMDLPVIMLSANGETETVMKGITHGACDYLLKPVRIERLRNILQHVLRRRKCDTTDGNNSNNVEDCEKAQIANSEGGQGSASNGVSDRDAKLNKKRKDQNEEDEDDCEVNMNENEDPSTQKKPRVVWSVELHRKFVAAVNQLGIDKAVPKIILDLMNVGRLTRENVASHLQKYRLYLQRISAVASQAKMAAAFGGRNPLYLPMGSLDRFRNFHPLVGSRQLPALTPFQPNGVLGRMNSPTRFGQQRLVPSGTVQHGHIHSNTSSHINDLRKHQGIGLLGNPHGNNLQGICTSMISEANTRFPGGFSGSGLAIGSSSNSFASITNNSLLFQGNQQHTLSGVLGGHSDVRMTSLSSDPFTAGLQDSSYLLDLGRCNDTWQVAVPSTKDSATNLLAASLSHNNVSPSNIPNNVTPIISHMDSNLHEVSSGRVVQHPASSLGGSIMHMLAGGDENSNFLRNSKQNLDEQKQTHACNSNLIFNMNSSMPHLHANDSIADSPTMNTGFTNENTDMNLIGQTSGAPFLQQNCKTDFQLSYKEGFILGTTKLHGGFSSNACSFDDLVNGITKPRQEGGRGTRGGGGVPWKAVAAVPIGMGNTSI